MEILVSLATIGRRSVQSLRPEAPPGEEEQEGSEEAAHTGDIAADGTANPGGVSFEYAPRTILEIANAERGEGDNAGADQTDERPRQPVTSARGEMVTGHNPKGYGA